MYQTENNRVQADKCQASVAVVTKEPERLFGLRLFMFSAIVGVLNSCFCTNFVVMLAVCSIEVGMLFYCFVKMKLTEYLGLYTIFLSFSMESPVFVGVDDFYGFKNFRILGLNLAVIMLLPLVILSLCNLKCFSRNIHGIHRSFFKKICLFTIVASILGVFTYLINDNSVADAAGSQRVLINNYYSFYLPLIELFVVSWIVVRNPKSRTKLKKYLFSLILGMVVVYLVCVTVGVYGNRGGLNSLQVPEVSMILIVSPCLLLSKKIADKDKVLILFASVTIIGLSLFYNTSGKLLLVVILTPVILLFLAVRNGEKIKILKISFVCLIAGIIFLCVVVPYMEETSKLFSIKLYQVKAVLNFKDFGWLKNMPESPKMRITEFLNIANELIARPWFILFGKGFGGTVTDSLKLFSDLTESAFSAWELKLGAYYGVHESVNIFFLTGGVFGIYILGSTSWSVIKSMHRSPWLVYGLVWLLLFYNYHMTLAFMGIVAMIIGLVDAQEPTTHAEDREYEIIC